MGLAEKYAAQSADEALGKRIRAAAARFMAEQPDYLPIEANEKIMLRTLREQDIPPTSAGNFHEAFAFCREQLTPVRKQTPKRAAPAAPRLTHEDVDRMPLKEFQSRLERDPAFVVAVNALPPRR